MAVSRATRKRLGKVIDLTFANEERERLRARRGGSTYSGWVYFIQAGGRKGPIKIGYTSNQDVDERLKALQTGSFLKLRILGQVEGDLRDESDLHRIFSYWRMEGEWFYGQASGLIALIDHLCLRLEV